MTISDHYLTLLDHLGTTRPVRDLLGTGTDVVALRHDVDHDLDLALEMAFWEHRRGAKATYFLLPSAPYWDDPLLGEKVLQLADYGHEIGLHLNGLAEWADGRVDDVDGRLRSALATLRADGVEVIGAAAHGDKSCYAHGVINNWVFSDLRPADPASVDGLSAEGVPSPDPAFRIPYPGDTITREDGATFALWSIPMADLGLAYEAVRLPMDGYYSDSGGTWSRSPDPMTVDLSTGRHQVLVHPEYYRGPQRFVFVLSTARSGSKWMARALARATNASVTHEHTLNHVLDEAGNEVPDHRTGAGFTRLLEDRVEVRRRIAQVRAVREDAEGDHIECNVYLPHCLDELREVYPDATLVHLHREPGLVVKSLLNREWYDTRYDDRHPVIAVDGWSDMTPLRKCCAYVTATNLDLARGVRSHIRLDAANSDHRVLIETFANHGVAVHQRLLETVAGTVVDPTRNDWVGDPTHWGDGQASDLRRDLAQVRRLLGYGPGTEEPDTAVAEPVHAHPRRERTILGPGVPDRAVAVGGQLVVTDHGVVMTTEPDRHAYLLLCGGVWNRLPEGAGWPTGPGLVVVVRFRAQLSPHTPATLFGLTYAASGELLADRRLAPLADGWSEMAFRPRPDGARFNIGFHVPRRTPPTPVTLTLSAVEIVAEEPDQPAGPAPLASSRGEGPDGLDHP